MTHDHPPIGRTPTHQGIFVPNFAQIRAVFMKICTKNILNPTFEPVILHILKRSDNQIHSAQLQTHRHTYARFEVDTFGIHRDIAHTKLTLQQRLWQLYFFGSRMHISIHYEVTCYSWGLIRIYCMETNLATPTRPPVQREPIIHILIYNVIIPFFVSIINGWILEQVDSPRKPAPEGKLFSLFPVRFSCCLHLLIIKIITLQNV
jgi:hypothetical protein